MKNIKNISRWLDKNILVALAGFLIVFIPLYPKIPLADILPGYIVRIRLEDLAILVTLAVFLVQLIRKKFTIPRYKVIKFILLYLVIGLLSTLSAIYITKTVPPIPVHINKIYLHLFRRIEYFSLFFIAYAATKTRKQRKLFLVTIIATSLGVALYGFGQKYSYWPAFSTMNREFSKGVRLYLGPNSRVMSTFAGHYDLAAYIMMLLTLILPFIWLSKKKLTKIVSSVVFVALYWTLILTASRTSFIGYLVGITVVSAVLMTIKGFRWAFPRWLLVLFFSILVMVTMGDLSDRFFQLINLPAESRTLAGIQAKLIRPKKDNPPPNSISEEELEIKVAKVTVKSDAPPTTKKPAPLPPDVTKEEDDLRRPLESTKSATVSATTGGGYSPNALKYGLSVAIRLDALWPRAIEGFKRNPILGSGYSTLVKSNPGEFTYAESTDNDYLRMLGETGILGAFTFLAIPALLVIAAFKNLKKLTGNSNKVISDRALLVGFIGLTAALLVNATYIDVFESSKVIYTYWILAAIVVKTIEFNRSKNEKIHL